MELEGLGFNLCVALPCVVVSLILEDKGRIGVRDGFIVKDKSRTRMTRRRFPSHRARRGLSGLMLREDYVEDKSIF